MAEIVLVSDVNGALGFSRYAGPYRIATELRDHGYDVQVIDFFASFDIDTICKIIKTHVDKDTLFVGFSATLWTKYVSDEEIEKTYLSGKKSLRSIIVDGMVKLFPHPKEEVEEIFNQIKLCNPRCKIVVGGYKAANYDTNGVDFWVLGQGERSALAIANHIKYGENLNVLDTHWGNIITDQMYPYSKFNTSKIKWHKTDFLFPGENVPIETARGCIFKCSFCAFNLNGKRFGDYTKTAETLRQELIKNYEKWNITEYMVSDDTLNDSMQKVNFLYDVVMSLPFQIQFSAYARLDVLGANWDMAPMLKEMGLRSVEFGIETMNKETGKYIGKQADPDKIKNNLDKLKEIWKDDVHIAAGFIIGLPYESEESIRKTMDWLYEKDNPLTGVQLNRYWWHIPPSLPRKLGDYYDLESAGFNLTPKGWVYENISKIYSNPEFYGYEQKGERDWKNTHLDTETAKKLENEFYNDHRAPQKKCMGIFQYYNRMRNIGYKHHEIKHLYYDDYEFVKNAVKQRKIAKEKYLNRIL